MPHSAEVFDLMSLRVPIVVAPMAGGPSTPALVIAAAQAEAIGLLAGGYKSVNALAGEIDEVAASGVGCLLYTSPSPRDATLSRMPSSA